MRRFVCLNCDSEFFRQPSRTPKFCSRKCMGDHSFVSPELRLTFEQDADGCWIWTGAIDDGGYAVFSIRRKTVRLHKFMYEAAKGPIPKGLQVDHQCRKRACINPDCLDAVTSGENTRRGNRWPQNHSPRLQNTVYKHVRKRPPITSPERKRA